MYSSSLAIGIAP